MLQTLRNDTTERLIEETVDGLAAILQRDNTASWERAGFYLRQYALIAAEPDFIDKRGPALSRTINRRLRKAASERNQPFPPISWLTNALKLQSVWPELFSVGTKELSTTTTERLPPAPCRSRIKTGFARVPNAISLLGPNSARLSEPLSTPVKVSISRTSPSKSETSGSSTARARMATTAAFIPRSSPTCCSGSPTPVTPSSTPWPAPACWPRPWRSIASFAKPIPPRAPARASR